MKKRLRILFVTFADSPHAYSWTDLLRDSEFDVRVFTIPLHTRVSVPPPWQFPTYVVVQPDTRRRVTNRVMWLLPSPPRLKTFVNWVEDRFSLSQRWLKRVISTWRPDIVHSVPLDTGGKLTRKALQQLPKSGWPKWVASAWGNDIYLGLDEPDTRSNIEFILQHCDGYMADCRRDLRLAVEAGLAPSKLALADAAPGSGGLNLADFAAIRSADQNRNLILLPKAFERFAASGNRTLPVLEALRLVEDVLDGYEIHLVMCSKQVVTWLRKMPESIQQRCHCHGRLPQSELFDMLGRTRVMIAPSLSDGTPNVMLEAMAAGALPLMSPVESIQEWIEDGRNGLLSHALYPTQIAAALRRAIRDDELYESAKRINWELVTQRANRTVVREQVLNYYRSLVSAKSLKSYI